ncbi:putative cofactor-binding repeat protein [Granulicella aggregans]|uniref:Putative cofactor-binding repeat protein n=1 Tax=Granulicella aggregans TaxID=474949 RepID=A0A7W8E3Y3_9BACT|nr:FAD binding domain-containing protein [Granulicella aggregans]MBB5056615.1 putative cofactor-binding repeat protein [Granulicella aggregans]
MRSNVSQYDLIAPGSLAAVLNALADSPGEFTPIAGGTELMVALGAGRLEAKKLVSLWGIPELRFIEVSEDAVTIGAGTTFTDLRRHPVIASDFTLLAQAASWTGSIANQNRGTLGGNCVNASPAADSPPALLVYEAELTLISASGARKVPYGKFHLGYKKTMLRPDELLYSIQLKRNFSGYVSYARKVGTRNAQAISKVAIAALARVHGGVIEEIRLGAASLRETPARLVATELALTRRSVDAELGPTIAAARTALAGECRPIDDIRSTAKYRAAVAGNLVEEFLRGL